MCVCYVASVMTPWTVACQAPLSMGFPREEHWSGLPCPPPEKDEHLRNWTARNFSRDWSRQAIPENPLTLVMFNSTLKVVGTGLPLLGKVQLPRWETSCKPWDMDLSPSRWGQWEVIHGEQCQPHSSRKVMFAEGVSFQEHIFFLMDG